MRSRLVEHFAWVSDKGTWSSGADRNGWLRDPAILREIGPALAGLFADEKPTVVLGPQSSGFSLGALVAVHLGAGFVGARREINNYTDSDIWTTATTPPDYRDRHLEFGYRERLVSAGDTVLVVDDWVDTGGQLSAMKSLVAASGGRYLGAAVIVDALASHAVRRDLGVRSLLHVRDLR